YTLSVSSNIAGADVYINDQLYGKTPLNVSLPPATYKVVAKYAGYVDFVSSVNLSSNQNVTANFTPIKYTLSVVSNIRGAEVYINNQLKGKTPLSVSLPQASYEVVVKMARYKDFTANVNLTNNQTLSANLIQDVYVLSVSSSVTGADVYIGGQLKGKTPLNISLPPAAYSVTVKLEGYLDYNANINLTSSQNIIALLNPQKYIILSLPVGTKLWLNGKPYLLNWGNIKEDSKFDNVKTDIDDKKEKYKEFKIYSETNKTDLIEIRYKNLVTGPINVEFNNKIKELRLSLSDK
ncbi:MAG: PEGA domain-containing protein, partial [Spirochaetes bacterium]|nr:PEGA domain-containing protein [Spirochaetota bacterium]